MPAIFNADDRRRHRLFNGPQFDPTQAAAKAGMPYHARRSVKTDGGRVLMPDDFMPIGDHSGKHLRAVPTDYLRWIDAQPWAATWREWQPVRDYLSRFPLPPAPLPEITLTVDAVRIHPGSKGIFREGASRLYVTQDDHLPYLHAFAHGALDLWRQWFRPADATAPPHYLLTPAAQKIALDLGASLVSTRAAAADADDWRKTHGHATADNPAGPQFHREMPDGTTQCTKHCYGTLKEAQTAINHRTQGRQPRRNTRPAYLRAYECPRCSFWHLTSKPDQFAE
jgi:hypothetical protein